MLKEMCKVSKNFRLFIRDHGYSNLARVIGTDRQNVFNWHKSVRCPCVASGMMLLKKMPKACAEYDLHHLEDFYTFDRVRKVRPSKLPEIEKLKAESKKTTKKVAKKKEPRIEDFM